MTRNRITRFAPSPTGFLHLGHVASALHAREMAGEGGRFLIRIEDIDPSRCTKSLTEALEEDLSWLGFTSSGPVRRQSQHFPEYRQALEWLKSRRLLYPCFCTRADVSHAASRKAPDGSVLYPGTCRGGAGNRSGRVPVWRLDMPRALDLLQGAPSWNEAGSGRVEGRPEAFGDVVLARRDTGVSYHLCVTYDDALQNVTCVTRGQDLYEATAVHRVLQSLMGWPEPEYAHHPLLMGADGRKLSKRDGAEAIRTLKEQGWSADDVLRHPDLQAMLR